MINIKQVKKDDLSKLTEIYKDIFDYPTSIKDFENYFFLIPLIVSCNN